MNTYEFLWAISISIGLLIHLIFGEHFIDWHRNYRKKKNTKMDNISSSECKWCGSRLHKNCNTN